MSDEPKIEVRNDGTELWRGCERTPVMLIKDGLLYVEYTEFDANNVKQLLPYLQTFADTGRFDKPPEKYMRRIFRLTPLRKNE